MKFFSILFVSILFLSACSDKAREEAPLKVHIGTHYNEIWNYYSPSITIVSTVDNLAVESLVVNRGNCKTSFAFTGRLCKNLKYGQSCETTTAKDCREILHIKVETDKGSWEYKFD